MGAGDTTKPDGWYSAKERYDRAVADKELHGTGSHKVDRELREATAAASVFDGIVGR